MIYLISVLLGFFHPFYISVTEINHNAKAKTMEISTKIFFDDLEKQLELEENISIDIIKPTNKEHINKLLGAYLKKHIQIKLDGKILPFNYVGYEIQEDAAWCYYEIPQVNKFKTVEVFNDLLHKIHPEQINMLNITAKGKRQSTKLDFPEKKALFNF